MVCAHCPLQTNAETFPCTRVIPDAWGERPEVATGHRHAEAFSTNIWSFRCGDIQCYYQRMWEVDSLAGRSPLPGGGVLQPWVFHNLQRWQVLVFLCCVLTSTDSIGDYGDLLILIICCGFFMMFLQFARRTDSTGKYVLPLPLLKVSALTVWKQRWSPTETNPSSGSAIRSGHHWLATRLSKESHGVQVVANDFKSIPFDVMKIRTPTDSKGSHENLKLWLCNL